jgi:hypothetical protein
MGLFYFYIIYFILVKQFCEFDTRQLSFVNKKSIYKPSHSEVAFLWPKLNTMKLNTENLNFFVYETEELLIELLGGVRIDTQS